MNRFAIILQFPSNIRAQEAVIFKAAITFKFVL
jgi:hypothetical protein